MFKSYTESLILLKNSIPDDYSKKKELVEKIDFCLVDISYKPPEVLSICFHNYCNLLIPYLPQDRKNNMWVDEPWKNIHNVAKINNNLLNQKKN